MHRQIKNKDGSALVWAILVLAMLSIIVATVLTVALSYQRRSYINNYSQQAYFTSRSAADAISNEIVGGGTHLIPAVGKTINLGTLKFAKGKMGECTAKVVRNDEYSMTVTATTTLRGGSTSYSTRIISDNIVVPQFAGGLRVSKLNASDKFTVNGDVYVTDFDVSEINCHVTGNVFAPKGSIALMSEGNVAGSIIAYGSIKSGTPFSPKYFPLMALSTEGITGFTKSTKQYPVFDQFSRLFSYTNQFTSPFVTFPIIPTDDEMKRGSLNLVDSTGKIETNVALSDGGTYYIDFSELKGGIPGKIKLDYPGTKKIEATLYVIGDVDLSGGIAVDSKAVELNLILSSGSKIKLGITSEGTVNIIGDASNELELTIDTSINGNVIVGSITGGKQLEITSAHRSSAVIYPHGWKLGESDSGE